MRVWIMIAAVVLLVAGVVAQSVVGRGHVRDEARASARRDLESDIRSRERGNIARADRIIDSMDADDSPLERSRVRRIFPIIDPATEKPLGPSEVRKYVAIVAARNGDRSQARIPLIQEGRVTGSKPFPPSQH